MLPACAIAIKIVRDAEVRSIKENYFERVAVCCPVYSFQEETCI